jgi:serine/threonine protein kinase
MFKQVPPAHLPSLLPNLPLDATAEVPSDANPGPFPHFPVGEMTPSPLDLLQRFLVYPPPQRLKAAEALRHPWFVAEPSVILPAGYPANSFETNFPDHPSSIEVWENKGLGEWLIAALNAVW